MLDQLDLGRTVSKHEYKERLPLLQARLFDLEQALLQARVPVLILFEGWAGTSKIGTIGLLTRRLDPRGLRVHSIAPPRTSETMYPWLQRFWLKIRATAKSRYLTVRGTARCSASAPRKNCLRTIGAVGVRILSRSSGSWRMTARCC